MNRNWTMRFGATHQSGPLLSVSWKSDVFCSGQFSWKIKSSRKVSGGTFLVLFEKPENQPRAKVTGLDDNRQNRPCWVGRTKRHRPIPIHSVNKSKSPFERDLAQKGFSFIVATMKMGPGRGKNGFFISLTYNSNWERRTKMLERAQSE